MNYKFNYKHIEIFTYLNQKIHKKNITILIVIINH
jgi:hypothetical protein